LIIGGDERLALADADAMSALGWQIQLCASATGTLERLEREPFDAVLLALPLRPEDRPIEEVCEELRDLHSACVRVLIFPGKHVDPSVARRELLRFGRPYDPKTVHDPMMAGAPCARRQGRVLAWGRIRLDVATEQLIAGKLRKRLSSEPFEHLKRLLQADGEPIDLSAPGPERKSKETASRAFYRLKGILARSYGEAKAERLAIRSGRAWLEPPARMREETAAE
jgi:DNA-binding response OmpR family regulator